MVYRRDMSQEQQNYEHSNQDEHNPSHHQIYLQRLPVVRLNFHVDLELLGVTIAQHFW